MMESWAYIIIFCLSLCSLILLYLLIRIKTNPKKKHKTQNNVSSVGDFYNKQTHNFLKVYGEVIQAFRTKDVSVLLHHQAKVIGMEPGMVVLDAGCGVCGPATFFAKNYGVNVEAITISGVQTEIAEKNIAQNDLVNKINITHGDYHNLEKYYPSNHFDAVYFLESFGHAIDHCRVLDSALKVLKPTGVLYIKDLFIKKSIFPEMEKGIQYEAENINRAYSYNIPELNEILDHVRKKGYILASLSTIDIPLEDFENLTISNDFQELTGINKIDNLRNYIFPVDFFELKILKPGIDILSGKSRYFLQNQYFMQIENWKEEDL